MQQTTSTMTRGTEMTIYSDGWNFGVMTKKEHAVCYYYVYLKLKIKLFNTAMKILQ